jgi:hypothetical protein
VVVEVVLRQLHQHVRRRIRAASCGKYAAATAHKHHQQNHHQQPSCFAAHLLLFVLGSDRNAWNSKSIFLNIKILFRYLFFTAQPRDHSAHRRVHGRGENGTRRSEAAAALHARPHAQGAPGHRHQRPIQQYAPVLILFFFLFIKSILNILFSSVN